MNRGSQSMGAWVPVAREASMRPRFMNRGSADAGVRVDRSQRAASMRPRFMNRGRSEGKSIELDPMYCFNEAPIHESGK